MYDGCFLTDEDLGKLGISSCMLIGAQRKARFRVRKTLLHFGLAKARAEDDWEAARSFCPLRLAFAADRPD